jgi:diacylglycerol kinase (ATP)
MILRPTVSRPRRGPAGTFFPFRATGTIRYVADGLAHTGIPLRLVPVGTGNLLARNLDLPLEE